jgi:hypothetical protein
VTPPRKEPYPKGRHSVTELVFDPALDRAPALNLQFELGRALAIAKINGDRTT